MREYKKYLKYELIILLVLSVSILIKPFDGKNIYQIFTVKTSYKETLTKERQDNYDKMKVDYVNVKNRITGTAPFNDGDTSNDKGVDVSENDDYVRTFDVIKYTIELGISPNTNVDGVTDSSIFHGGVIKVKAKLPNQGDLVLMTWNTDAWMQNVKFNDDKTEITVEYHVLEDLSITNANQNLTFTIDVGGYKKEVTSDMQPEFEVWMEGNKPDDATSKVDSVIIKDVDRKAIISGHQSLDIGLMNGAHLNNTGKLGDVTGNYYNVGVYVKLLQDVKGFSDLRGIEYPTDKIELELDFSYLYNDLSSNNGFETLIDSNNTSVVAYGLNADPNPKYYPTNNAYVQQQSLPIGSKQLTGKKDYDKSVEDSGIMNVNLNGKVIKLTEKLKHTLILDNFLNMEEDKLIEVMFVIDSEVNPDTGSFIPNLLLMLLLFAIIVYLSRKNKKIFKLK